MRRLFLGLGLAVSIVTLASCGSKGKSINYEYTVAAPKGAPAVALAEIAKENKNWCSFVEASTIAQEFTSGKDFVVAPISAGATLYKNNKSDYKLLAVLTWGNTYFACQDEITLESLNGKDIVLFGKNTSNAAAARFVLNKNGITPKSISYEQTAQGTKSLLISDSKPIVMTAEPILTQTIKSDSKYSNISYISVQDELKKVKEDNKDYAYTQAGIFVNPSVDSDKVKSFEKKLKKSCDMCKTDLNKVAEDCVDLGILGTATLDVAKEAIPRCSIEYMSITDSKKYVEETANLDISTFGGVLPVNEFYYK